MGYCFNVLQYSTIIRKAQVITPLFFFDLRLFNPLMITVSACYLLNMRRIAPPNLMYRSAAAIIRIMIPAVRTLFTQAGVMATGSLLRLSLVSLACVVFFWLCWTFSLVVFFMSRPALVIVFFCRGYSFCFHLAWVLLGVYLFAVIVSF